MDAIIAALKTLQKHCRDAGYPALAESIEKILTGLAEASQTPPQGPTSHLPPQPAALPTLNDLMLAMRDFEGAPGDLNYRNNNPLNCRCSRVGYAKIYGAVQCVNNFARFPSLELGWLYAKNLLTQKIEKHPDWTILQLIGDKHEGWAPAEDNNDPKRYAKFLADRCGVDIDYPIKKFIA